MHDTTQRRIELKRKPKAPSSIAQGLFICLMDSLYYGKANDNIEIRNDHKVHTQSTKLYYDRKN